MGCTSSAMRPQELVEFRKLNTTIENVEIPARPESRTLTDKKGFVLFGIAIVILLPLLIYSFTKTDLRHLNHAADECGDFCGLDNEHIEGLPCGGNNFIDKPYLEDDICTDSCRSGRVTLEGECISEKGANQIENDRKIKLALGHSRAEGWKFFVTILITIVLSVLTLVVLRYIPALVVWAVLILSITVTIAIAGLLWYLYSLTSSNTPRTHHEDALESFQDGASKMVLLVAVIWTFFAAILLTVILVLIKKIRLIIQLYKEAVKVLAAMPMLIIVTILITLVEFVILGLFYATTFYLSMSLELYELEDKGRKIYLYLHSPLISFTIFLNIVVTIWVMHFVSGVQYMIISGSVARWFYAKNKEYLESPILTSTKVALKYHLGTVAFGSFFIMLFSVVKSIIRAFCRNVCCRCCFVICCSSVEILLKFISENSYIQTAVHGQSFCKSAKRATNLLLTNVKSVAAINCVGDFVLFIIVFLVTLLATVISLALFMNPEPAEVVFPTFICLVINAIIVSITFTTFQIIIDTLLLCFCEDSVLNDGISRPYYMSRGLMEFVENSKKMYG